MLYTIGEIAKISGLRPSTLRYYDKEGLFPAIERTSGGIRMFRDSDVEWLHVIECLKKTGMTVREIRTFVGWVKEGDSTISKRKEFIERQRKTVAEQMEKLKETLDTLDYKCWYYSVAEKAGTCDVHKTLPGSRNSRKNSRNKKALEKELIKIGGYICRSDGTHSAAFFIFRSDNF